MVDRGGLPHGFADDNDDVWVHTWFTFECLDFIWAFGRVRI